MAIHKYLAFVRVAEMGSITKAAEAMGYTQSAVSRMVADLEDDGTSICFAAAAAVWRFRRTG